MGATTAQRGAALHDLLGLADRIPTRDRPPLAFPSACERVGCLSLVSPTSW